VLSKLKLFGVLLAIPLVGYFTLKAVNNSQEHEWHQALERTYKDVPEERLSLFNLDKVCDDAQLASKLDASCSAFSHVQAIKAFALWGSVASVCFPFLVMLAGFICPGPA
jgi:hypothetical protein